MNNRKGKQKFLKKRHWILDTCQDLVSSIQHPELKSFKLREEEVAFDFSVGI